jgi:hypothetical protein
MSGGPVLNTNGEVVGIHGRGDRDANTGVKTGFNAGITIAKFAELARDVGAISDLATAAQIFKNSGDTQNYQRAIAELRKLGFTPS